MELAPLLSAILHHSVEVVRLQGKACVLVAVLKAVHRGQARLQAKPMQKAMRDQRQPGPGTRRVFHAICLENWGSLVVPKRTGHSGCHSS